MTFLTLSILIITACNNSYNGLSVEIQTVANTKWLQSQDSIHPSNLFKISDAENQVSAAKKVYSYYKRTNENAIGFKELPDIGDEAWFASSPLFIYVRKDNKIFVMKVNKMTGRTSLNQFNLIAKQIADF